MTELTDGARAALERYLVDTRRSLAPRDDVNVDDVVADLREHVEADLAARGVARATAEDMSAVLAHLGPPGTWVDAGNGAGFDRVPALAALLLAGTGLAFLLIGLQWSLGWALLVLGALVARAWLPKVGAPRTVEGQLAHGLWSLAAGAGLLALLLGPAALVWAASQTGGALEGLLARHVDIQGTEHPTAYWVTMAVLAGAVTGAWWTFVGWTARRFRKGIRRVFGSASPLVPARSGEVLVVTGLVVLLVSLVGLWV